MLPEVSSSSSSGAIGSFYAHEVEVVATPIKLQLGRIGGQSPPSPTMWWAPGTATVLLPAAKADWLADGGVSAVTAAARSSARWIEPHQRNCDRLHERPIRVIQRIGGFHSGRFPRCQPN